MATNFPSSVDSFTNPTTSDTLASVPHASQHADVNDAVEAIETALLDGAPLHIDDANERVGIGTTTPSQELDVNGDIVVPVGNGIMFDRVGSDSHILYKETPGSSTYGSPDDVVLRNPNGARLRFQTNGTNDRMTIDSSGNVGINDTTPSYTLDVNGDINTTGNLRFQGTVGYTYVQTLYFTSSGTFTKATYPWLRAVRVKVQAGGGAGGGASATSASESSAGGGGGGGGYAESFIIASSISSSETVTVGSGGAAVSGAPGNDGGNSSFGSLVAANGGLGGTRRFNSTVQRSESGSPGGVGDGGVGTAGDLQIGGGGGGVLLATFPFAVGGAGGNAMFGGAGKPSATGASSGGRDGQNGQNYGGGGSGAMNNQTQSARPGGNGGNGIVIVELFA